MKVSLKKCRKIILFIPIFFLLILGSFVIADHFLPLPIKDSKPTQTILAQDGSPLWRFADQAGMWRYPVSLNDVPDYYLEALLTYEDRHFYDHMGIDFSALARATWQNITSGKVISGGSTISMQVARLIDPHPRTLLGKLQQIFRTLQLEWHYSKKDILTMYINRAPYGGTIEGIGAASFSYLGKHPSQLTRSEAVLFAVLPQAPSRLRPDRYPVRATQARDKVLDRLVAYKVWSEDIIEMVRQDEVWVFPRKTPQLAPLLARRLSELYPNQAIIQSTIDPSLQHTLEDMALNWKNQLPPKTSLAILVVDHTDMAVKGYIGSIDFNDASRFGQVDMIKALRSPGSTLKPFLYGLAMDDGMIHSQSLLQDVPRITSDYRPTNFDEGFNGPVSTAESLQRSLNLPAVQLMEQYGAKRFASQLNDVGLSLYSSGNSPNISYILGGTSVKMEDLVSSYSAFARKGAVSPLRFTVNDPIVDKKLMSAGSAWVTRRIMAKQDPADGAKNITDLAPLAWKTGTSYGYRDAWAMGISPRYLIGVWVGRPDGTPVVGQYGNVTSVPILQQVNTLLHNKDRQRNKLLPVDPMPESVSIVDICWPSGQDLDSADPNCHQVKKAWIVDDMIPPTLDTLNILQNNSYKAGWLTIWVNKSGQRVASDCVDATQKSIALWPIALEKWLLPNQKREALIPPMDPECPIFGESAFSPLLITGIQAEQILQFLPGKNELTISINSQGGQGARWWFLDGNLIKSTSINQPILLTFNRRHNQSKKQGQHQLILMDESGQIDRVSFRVK